MRILLTFLVTLIITPMAQADTDPYQAMVFECYETTQENGDISSCIGKVAEQCMETEPNGYSTLGMSECTQRETAAWNQILNREWALVKTFMQKADAEDEKYDQPHYVVRWEKLLAAQRAWLAFRDAECGFEYAQWGSGSMRYTAHGGCMLDMTANRVVRLREYRRTY